MNRPRTLVVAILAIMLGTVPLLAGDLRIPLPKKSKYTPVQKLNRDGVKAIEHHDYQKAKKLFYQAYLIDPNDPFTLNNLGYLAELEGHGDRAERFYQLASEQRSDAVVDLANNPRVQGKPVAEVAGNAGDTGINVNRLNSEAITLLQKDRAPEADLILQKALKLDPRNPFTLNNLGYAREREGELASAYQYYTAAANTNSHERVVIAINNDWRGKRISEVARENASNLNKRMQNGGDLESQVALLNLRGVSAFNRNDPNAAKEYIKKAYKLDPDNAFTLNNMGFLAEMDGDKETADYFYDRARNADSRGAHITLATRSDVEGKKIGELAQNTDDLVLNSIAERREELRRMGGPVLLRRRNNSLVIEPKKPVAPPRRYYESDANGVLLLPPLESTRTSQPTTGGIAMPTSNDQQPVTVHQGPTDHGLIMPLPDNQQPGTVTPNIQQGPTDHGLIMPLPESQQPGVQPQQSQPREQPPAAPPSPPPTTNYGNTLLLPVPDKKQQQNTPAPPKRISDTNLPPAKSPDSGVKKITDQQ